MSLIPKLYLTEKDFNINQEKLYIEARDNIIILCVISDSCSACNGVLNSLTTLNLKFPEIVFAIINVRIHKQILDIFKMANINITTVPTFMLFKIGIFDKILNINLTPSEILSELSEELYANVKPKPVLNNYF